MAGYDGGAEDYYRVDTLLHFLCNKGHCCIIYATLPGGKKHYLAIP